MLVINMLMIINLMIHMSMIIMLMLIMLIMMSMIMLMIMLMIMSMPMILIFFHYLGVSPIPRGIPSPTGAKIPIRGSFLRRSVRLIG